MTDQISPDPSAAEETPDPAALPVVQPMPEQPMPTQPALAQPMLAQPGPMGAAARRSRPWAGRWRRFWAPGLVGVILGGLLGSGITALALHGGDHHGHGDFRRFGQPGPGFGPGYGYGGPFRFRGPGGLPRGGLPPGQLPLRPGQPAPPPAAPTPAPTGTG